MQIRRMQTSDLGQILPLAGQLGFPNQLADLQLRFQSLLNNSNVGLFVGVLGHEIASFMQLSLNYTLMTGPRAELNSIVVDEKYRGQGYGKLMLAKAEQWAKEKGINKVRLGSSVNRIEAHEFYKKSGYEIDKTWYVFSKEVT